MNTHTLNNDLGNLLAWGFVVVMVSIGAWSWLARRILLTAIGLFLGVVAFVLLLGVVPLAPWPWRVP